MADVQGIPLRQRLGMITALRLASLFALGGTLLLLVEDFRANLIASPGKSKLISSPMSSIWNLTQVLQMKLVKESCQEAIRVASNTASNGFLLTPGVAVDPNAYHLNCDELQRSIGTWQSSSFDSNATSDSKSAEPAQLLKLGLFRLAQRLRQHNMTLVTTTRRRLVDYSKNISSTTRKLKVVVIGGSMTAGSQLRSNGKAVSKDAAWPGQLEQMLNNYFNATSSLPWQVVNLAVGGADEKYWSARISEVLRQSPIDVILVESAVNDQCDYKDIGKRSATVSNYSRQLLNELVHLPGSPAVLSVELFRTAGDNKKDVMFHCPKHFRVLTNSSAKYPGKYYYCPEWWMPQDWRDKAREFNSVPAISYRDAVWPELDHPRHNLSAYWEGLSHPVASTHYLVAKSVLFGLLVATAHAELWLQQTTMTRTRHGNHQLLHVDEGPFLMQAPSSACFSPHMDYMPSINVEKVEDERRRDILSIQKDNLGGGCWEFRADVRDRYGWICEVSKNAATSTVNGDKGELFATFRKKIQVGGSEPKIVFWHLVSYDDRMATVKVWFSTADNITKSENVFQGSPTWEVSSFHKERTSIPKSCEIQLGGNKFTTESGLIWPEEEVTVESSKGVLPSPHNKTLDLILNVQIVRGSSTSVLGTDKFKFLGIVSC